VFIFFKLIYIYIFYIKDELREKISEKLSIPPHKQHFLNWTMRSYDDRVGIILIILYKNKTIFFSIDNIKSS